jgi:hypothetical protein
MTKAPLLVITRNTPTADHPNRYRRHLVDQNLWFSLFGRYRQPSTIPTPGQCPFPSNADSCSQA